MSITLDRNRTERTRPAAATVGVQNFTDAELIGYALDSANWRDAMLMLEIQRRSAERVTFQDPMLEAMEREGIDPGAFHRAMLEAEETIRAESAKTAVTVQHGKTVPLSTVNVTDALVSVDDVEEEETHWLVPAMLPRGTIVVFAGDGGTGKTSVLCNIAASITTGKHSILTADMIPEDFTGMPEDVLYLAAEDDFARVLKRKLRTAGADMKRIFTVPVSNPAFAGIKFNSEVLRELIEKVKPGLVIFDPIQSFVPPDIQMGWRNAMRQCLSPLISMGEEFAVTSVLVCHTNKQQGLSGRRRIAESSDIWDIARSVLMLGDAGNGIKYCSHEKCNYGELQKTLLYSLDGESILFKGRSDLKDDDFVRKLRTPKAAPAKDDAKNMIIKTLESSGGKMKSADLDGVLIGQGIAKRTFERAKSELQKDRKIMYFKDGFQGIWMTKLIATGANGGE